MLNYKSLFWRGKVFDYVSVAAALFIVLTVVAMFFYPGGTRRDPTIQDYSFFRNFFSDLGRLHTFSGDPNLISASLFFSAMIMIGFSAILFSMAFPQFFQKQSAGRIPGLFGSLVGIITGICFIGVAFTPADILIYTHIQFSRWGFRFFMAAAFLWAIAIFRHGKYSKRYGWVFVGFGVLLVGYILLPYILWMILGPPPYRTLAGNLNIINATAQKIIVYASIVSVMIQSYGAKALNKTRFPSNEARIRDTSL